MIERQLQEQIEKHLGSDKAIIIIGARQVGKSTLLNSIFSNMENVMWLNGDDADVQELFRNMTAARMKAFLGKKKFFGG